MRGSMNEALLRHPEIVVHLREIFVAGVGNESDDAFQCGLLSTITQRTREECAGGRSAENSFLAQKLARGRKTFLIVNFECIGYVREVGNLGNKIFTDAFDRPASRLNEFASLDIFVENRARRISQNHFDAASRFDTREESAKSS